MTWYLRHFGSHSGCMILMTFGCGTINLIASCDPAPLVLHLPVASLLAILVSALHTAAAAHVCSSPRGVPVQLLDRARVQAGARHQARAAAPRSSPATRCILPSRARAKKGSPRSTPDCRTVALGVRRSGFGSMSPRSRMAVESS